MSSLGLRHSVVTITLLGRQLLLFLPEGVVSMDELKGKLATLDDRRTIAERELDKLTRHQEHIAKLGRDTETLMERYRFEAREGLDLYTLEDRHNAYKALGINVIAYPDRTIGLIGSVLPEVDSDSVRSMPIERIESLRSALRFRVPLGSGDADKLEVISVR